MADYIKSQKQVIILLLRKSGVQSSVSKVRLYMSEMMRRCGGDWVYCGGECGSCANKDFTFTDTTYEIVELCPKCHGRLMDIMLTSNPPIPKKVCVECGWSWTGRAPKVKYVVFGGGEPGEEDQSE